MSRLDKITLGFLAVWSVAFTAFAAHHTPFLQLISMPLVLVFLCVFVLSFVRIFTRWRARRWRALIPFLFCTMSVAIGIFLARALRSAIFAWSLPSYEAVIREMQSGSIPVPEKFDLVREAQPKARLTYVVFAERAPDGALSVEFDTERGFPVKHSGYVYCSSGIITKGSFLDSRWPIKEKVREHWYYVSD